MGNSKSKSFFENFSWTFVGSLVYALSQWLLIVILAKLGTPEVVGQFSLGLAITAPIILFSNMQMRNLVATDSTNDYEFSEYLSSRLLLLILGFVIIIIVVIMGSYSLVVSIAIILVGFSKVVESLSELTHGYFQKIERMDYAGKSLVYKAISSLIAFSLIFYLTRNLNYALIGLIFAWILRLFLYDLKYTKKYVSIRPKISNFKKIILFSLPLGFVSTLTSLNVNIPRYFLENFGGIEELGYFSAIAYVLVGGNLLVRPLSIVAAPRLAESFQTKNFRRYLKLLSILLLSALLIGIVILLIIDNFGEIILTLIYGKEYAAYKNIFFIIMGGSVISYLTMFLNTGVIATKKFKLQPLISCTTLIVALVTSLLLIPSYGIVGAAYVTVFVFISNFIGNSILLGIIIIKSYNE